VASFTTYENKLRRDATDRIISALRQGTLKTFGAGHGGWSDSKAAGTICATCRQTFSRLNRMDDQSYPQEVIDERTFLDISRPKVILAWLSRCFFSHAGCFDFSHLWPGASDWLLLSVPLPVGQPDHSGQDADSVPPVATRPMVHRGRIECLHTGVDGTPRIETYAEGCAYPPECCLAPRRGLMNAKVGTS